MPSRPVWRDRWQRLHLRYAADTIPHGMSVDQIKRAIDQLSFEERAEVAAWLHGWQDDNWDEQMKRDIAEGKLDAVLREVDEDIQAGRLTDMP